MEALFKLRGQPKLQSPSLIVGWSVDTGNLGAKVTDYLNRKLACQSFAEIEPVGFFPLGGTAVEDDMARFPESKFYYCSRNDLVIFIGDPPSYKWYKFLNLILDIAEHYCPVKELYTIGGMISLGPSTASRELLGTFNSPELKKTLSDYNFYNLTRELDYETPPGQRPTLSSFLLWTAKRRNIPGINLWVPIPYRLVAMDDPKAEKRILEFFNQRFDLQIDLSDLE